MLKIGNPFPAFTGKAVSAEKLANINPNNVFIDIDNQSYHGKWLVMFFYPKDFTFVCPTEIAAFNQLNDAFNERDAQIIGVSTDSEYAHWAWRRYQAELNDLSFPLFSDGNRQLTTALGILDPAEGVALRATYIIDPDGLIRHLSINDLNVGRNPKETLRILDALQTDELCPCNWKKGDAVLKNEEMVAG